MKKILNAIGLLFFLPMMNMENDKGIMSSLVVFNELLCHISRTFTIKNWELIRNYDILCNFIMITYIIHYSNYNSMIIFLDFLGVYIFLMNYFYYGNNFLLHIFGVQLPLSITASLYRNTELIEINTNNVSNYKSNDKVLI